MDAFQAILSRTSYRGKYGPTPVPREHLRQLLEAGVAAPSGCNKQTTSFIAVDDPVLLEKLNAARLGMDEAAPYINTGVLLYNLPALRADLEQLQRQVSGHGAESTHPDDDRS